MTFDASAYPNDLVPLPTQPWEERPADYPIDIEEARTALWIARGNITKAAAGLRVTSLRLRKMVQNSVRLSREVEECRQMKIDTAEDIVTEALEDGQDKTRRDAMARFVLKSPVSRNRGYGSGGGVNVNLPGGGSGEMVISWANGENVVGAENIPEPVDGKDENEEIIEGTCEEVKGEANG